jgi:hypothetical protein
MTRRVCSQAVATKSPGRQISGERIECGGDVGLAHPTQVADADDAPAQRALAPGEHDAVFVPCRAQESAGEFEIGKDRLGEEAFLSEMAGPSC